VRIRKVKSLILIAPGRWYRHQLSGRAGNKPKHVLRVANHLDQHVCDIIAACVVRAFVRLTAQIAINCRISVTIRMSQSGFVMFANDFCWIKILPNAWRGGWHDVETIAMAKSIPLGAQATVAVETVDVLRKHGLNGIYTIMLRQEFLAAADLLRKALGINRTAWPLSVHELSAAIFYALAQHRAMRGLNPEGEHLIHAFKNPRKNRDDIAFDKGLEESEKLYSRRAGRISDLVSDDSAETSRTQADLEAGKEDHFLSVCDPVSDNVLQSLIFYSPLALTFIYAETEVDMQLLAAQQGWRLLYAHLDNMQSHPGHDIPASAVFVHDEHKIFCISCRGTTTISDVVTDLRQVAVPFPDSDFERSPDKAPEDGWTNVREGQGIAVCGMSNAAVNLYHEHIDSLLFYAYQGYRVRLTGHSLGGGVATLLGVLVQRDLTKQTRVELKKGEAKQPCPAETEEDAPLKVYAYGSPSCVDRNLGDFADSFVTTAVLHDDVIPRLTPSSCRGLLKYLLHIRETWVREHLPDDIMAITDRAKTAWAPRWRGSFTLPTSSTSIKRYCRKHIQYGKKKLMSVREKLASTNQDGDRDAVAAHEPVFALIDEEIPQPLLVDYMGGLDAKSAAAIVIEGDEFFDAGDSLIEGNEESETDSVSDGPLEGETSQTVAAGMGKDDSSTQTDEKDSESSPGAVVLEETPLPRMFLAGKIAHIYSHRGVYKVAYVPRDFRELRRISLAGNMLSDHKCKPYYEALLEVRTVRRATEAPPLWTAFDEDGTW
jgi:hypothetical protein